MILPSVIENIINKYINELDHIDNFKKYKNDLIRSFHTCISICENCDKNICNDIYKEFLHYSDILIEDDLCDGCDKNYCNHCEDKIYICDECGDVGMYENDYIYFNGPKMNFCYGCDRDICENCFDNMDCDSCGFEYCPDCVNEDNLCGDCKFDKNSKNIIKLN